MNGIVPPQPMCTAVLPYTAREACAMDSSSQGANADILEANLCAVGRIALQSFAYGALRARSVAGRREAQRQLDRELRQ